MNVILSDESAAADEESKDLYSCKDVSSRL
jgi:hypothetical protein